MTTDEEVLLQVVLRHEVQSRNIPALRKQVLRDEEQAHPKSLSLLRHPANMPELLPGHFLPDLRERLLADLYDPHENIYP